MRLKSSIGIGLALTVFLNSHPASADRSYALVVPREAAGRPLPVVDGVCDAGEYVNSWRFSRILYRPRVNYDPITLRLVSTADDLYVCVQGMPFRLGMVEPFVSLAFDVDHDGGTVPNTDDVWFTLSETGSLQAGRGTGTGGGFPDDPTLTGWDAAMGIYNEFYWTAEFRIPLSLIGGGTPGTVIGFHVRHNWLQFQGDDYIWPPNGGWNVPDTWGDLLWLRAPTGEGRVRLDEVRITQGLEFDRTAGVSHDLIAEKETLVRAQVYTRGSVRSIDRATLEVLRTAPSLGAIRRISANPVPAPRVNAYPYGYFNGSPVIDFWLDGADVQYPGDYRFTLRLRLVGSSTDQVIALGTRTFVETEDLRLLLLPWENTFEDTGIPWSSELTAIVPTAMAEVNRLFPLRQGAGSFNFFPGVSNAGLRYSLWFTGSCGPDDTTFGECDTTARAMANDTLHRFNRQLARSDRASERDRFDRICVLGATEWTQGGQAQFGWDPPTAGSGFDPFPDGGSASVITQEVMHCFDLVLRSSPNSNGGRHSMNREIPIVRGLPPVNMSTRMDVPGGRSVMFPIVTNIPVMFTEGQEWNDLRQAMLDKPRYPDSARADAELVGPPMFHFVGAIDFADQVSVLYSSGVDSDTLVDTPMDPGSPYEVVFLSSGSEVLARHPFPVSFESTQHDTTIEKLGLVITASMPQDTVRAEIRKNDTPLWGMDFSLLLPAVQNVVATDTGQGGIDLSWTASDPDSADLRYNIFYLPAVQTPTLPSGPVGEPTAVEFFRLPVALGVKQTSFFFRTDLVPAAPEARLVVEATDGVNTAEAESNTFAVPEQPPVTAIVNPVTTSTIVAGQPVTLVGSGYDATAGPLSLKWLFWESDKDGALGVGERLTVPLSAGLHTLRLTASAPSGMTATDTVDVEVLADSDGDGLPDKYEDSHPCLDSAVFDSDEDPDEDGLTSLGEWRLGTDPCDPDSDIDGIGDGDEFRLFGDPRDALSMPDPDWLFAIQNSLDLGVHVDQPITDTLTLRTLRSDVQWRAGATAPWVRYSPKEGTGDGEIQVWGDGKGLGHGLHTARLILTAPGSQPRLIDLSFLVAPASDARVRWRMYR